MNADSRRKEVLETLVDFTKPIDVLETDISQIPWDAPMSLITLTKDHVRRVLERYTSKALSPREVEQWANLLEVREDIAMEESVRDVVCRLANPILEGDLSEMEAQSLIKGPLSHR
jgi:hypothetical protein